MIDGKRFKFGYGDILVCGISETRQLCFQQLQSYAKCGDRVAYDVDRIGECIFIKVSFDDYQKLSKLLNMVKSREISEFVFKDYFFDFTKYNNESVNVCRQSLIEAIKLYLPAMAA